MWLTPSILLLVAASAVQAQVYGPFGCPEYQTSDLFTVDRVAEMVDGGGLIPYLASGTLAERYHSCQFLELHDGGKFTYSYKDSSGDIQTVPGRYEVVPSTFTSPGYLELDSDVAGILGSDLYGNVRLYPLHIDREKTVFSACSAYGLFHEEFAYTFLKPGARRSGDVGDIKLELTQKGVPLAAEMGTTDQSCFETDPIMRQRVPQFLQNLRNSERSASLSAARRRGAENLRRNPLQKDEEPEPRKNVQVLEH